MNNYLRTMINGQEFYEVRQTQCCIGKLFASKFRWKIQITVPEFYPKFK